MQAGQAGLLAQTLAVTATYDIIAVQPLSERVMQQASLLFSVCCGQWKQAATRLLHPFKCATREISQAI